jgi:hypothetical protein
VLSLPWPSNFSDSTNIKEQQATWVNVTSSAFNPPPLATAVAQQATAGITGYRGPAVQKPAGEIM